MLDDNTHLLALSFVDHHLHLALARCPRRDGRGWARRPEGFQDGIFDHRGPDPNAGSRVGGRSSSGVRNLRIDFVGLVDHRHYGVGYNRRDPRGCSPLVRGQQRM
jgi:hypothetical protein